jgi:hypothetical protein
VDQYAKAVEKATGKHVTVQNLSQHRGLTLPQLLDELDSFKQPLSAADVILVGIAHNSFELGLLAVVPAYPVGPVAELPPPDCRATVAPASRRWLQSGP